MIDNEIKDQKVAKKRKPLQILDFSDAHLDLEEPREDNKECRICMVGEDEDLGELHSPCRCQGSLKYVHIKCLK